MARRWFSSLPAVADVTDTWRNPAAVLHGVDDLRFEDFALPAQVQDGAVRVQMKSVGICGSDVAFLKKVRSDLLHGTLHDTLHYSATYVTQNRVPVSYHLGVVHS